MLAEWSDLASGAIWKGRSQEEIECPHVRTVVENPEVKQHFQSLDTFARPMSPRETTDFVNREREAWKAVVKQVGFSNR